MEPASGLKARCQREREREDTYNGGNSVGAAAAGNGRAYHTAAAVWLATSHGDR